MTAAAARTRQDQRSGADQKRRQICPAFTHAEYPCLLLIARVPGEDCS